MQDLYLIASFDKFGYKVEPSSLEKQVVQGEREISVCCAKMQGEIRVTTQGGESLLKTLQGTVQHIQLTCTRLREQRYGLIALCPETEQCSSHS